MSGQWKGLLSLSMMRPRDLGLRIMGQMVKALHWTPGSNML
jgi:hypothetical protein